MSSWCRRDDSIINKDLGSFLHALCIKQQLGAPQQSLGLRGPLKWGGSLCLQHSDCVCSRWLQMALSAAAPFYRGYVSDIDCRWGVISASVDDRTREERGLEVGMLSP